MFDKRFEGWYYKQSNGDITVAFIPGEADDGAFVQVITDSGSHIIRTEKLKIKGDTVKTGNCFFSPSGIKVRLPEIDADLRYTKKDNEAMSATMLDALRSQGFLD